MARQIRHETVFTESFESDQITQSPPKSEIRKMDIDIRIRTNDLASFVNGKPVLDSHG